MTATPEYVPPDLADWIGPGKRYATVADMARDAMRWHDEAQAEKMHSMKLEEQIAQHTEGTSSSATPIGDQHA